ncbi:hypothetical protein [Paenibacillus sp. NEAU-GSW1]|nr:hypothetical protein [Paenibacillus sp. NEAU-GSW1]
MIQETGLTRSRTVHYAEAIIGVHTERNYFVAAAALTNPALTIQ